MSEHKLIVGELSPFSQKAMALFRYKGVPFERVEVNPVIIRELLIPKTGRHLVPGMIKPDGQGLGDSTAIAHYLEENFPTPSIIPEDPPLDFFAHLLEDYFDEWLTKVFFCMRWSFKEDADNAAEHFARSYAGYDNMTADQVKTFMPARLTEQMHHLIGGKENAPFFHDQFDRIYEILNAHFAGHAFLLGNRPTIADFGLFGQAHQSLFDPTSGAKIRSHFPLVERWIEEFKKLAPDFFGNGKAEVVDWYDPKNLKPLFVMIEATYLSWLRANAETVGRGEKSYVLKLGGYDIRFPAGKYLVKCMNAVDRHYEALSPEERARANDLVQWSNGY